MKTVKKHIVPVAVILGALLWLNLLGIGCPVRYLTGVPCPACGMTRAVLALLRGNIAASLSYHALAMPAIVLLLFALHKDILPGRAGVKKAVLVAGGVCIFVYYVFRLLFGFIP